MNYKIVVMNGNYPLVYECAKACDAYGCMEELSVGLLHDIPIDMDEIMSIIVGMKDDDKFSFVTHRYHILKIY